MVALHGPFPSSLDLRWGGVGALLRLAVCSDGNSGDVCADSVPGGSAPLPVYLGA